VNDFGQRRAGLIGAGLSATAADAIADGDLTRAATVLRTVALVLDDLQALRGGQRAAPKEGT